MKDFSRKVAAVAEAQAGRPATSSASGSTPTHGSQEAQLGELFEQAAQLIQPSPLP